MGGLGDEFNVFRYLSCHCKCNLLTQDTSAALGIRKKMIIVLCMEWCTGYWLKIKRNDGKANISFWLC